MALRTLGIIALALVWLVSLPAACLLGPVDIETTKAVRMLLQWAGVAGPAFDPVHAFVMTQIRLPRVLMACCVGGGLAVAGAALQGLLRNPLADPSILGVSSGAACGASVAIAFGGVLAGSAFIPGVVLLFDPSLVLPAALMGAFAALVLVLSLGRSGGVYRRDVIILAGVAVSAFLGAGVALVKALAEDSVTGIVFWIMGSFQGSSWQELWLGLLLIVPGLIMVFSQWRALDLLRLGDDEAAQLGVAVRRSRLWIVCGTGFITAGCVATTGIIGFVGLVAPHIIRRFVGARHGLVLPASWFGGGLLLMWADVLARIVLDKGQELPVGVVTALVGGPFFAWIVCRRQAGQGMREDTL